MSEIETKNEIIYPENNEIAELSKMLGKRVNGQYVCRILF